MVEVASVFQTCQIGLEVTPGTAVPADKQLLALGLSPGIQAETRPFRPMGQKYNTLVPLDREWTVVPLEGVPTYSELIYPLSSILTGVPTALGGGAHQWLFNTVPGGADDVQTYTVEYGDASGATGARRFANAIVRSLGISISRAGGLTIRGEMIGRQFENGITMTASPTDVPLIPVLPSEVCVYLDTDSGDIGTTKLLRVFTADWNLNNKFNPVWPLDCAVQSFGATVEIAPELTLGLLMAYDDQGKEMHDRLRAGDIAFVRIEAIGAVIGGGNDYRMRIDFAGRVSEAQRPTDQEGIYAIGWTLQGVNDPDWGKVVEIEIQNAQAAL